MPLVLVLNRLGSKLNYNELVNGSFDCETILWRRKMNLLNIRTNVFLIALACFALPAMAVSDGLINIGDFLYVDVYRHDDLSTRTQVDSDGNITINYVGQVHVAGLTENQASAKVSKYLKRILKNPRVTISKTGIATFTASPRKEDMKTDMIALSRGSAKAISTTLQGMSSEGGSVSYDQNTNTLLVTDTPSTIENIRSVITRLDEIDSQLAQVRIETKFVEVQAGALKEFGIRWWAHGKESSGGFYPPATQSPGLTQLSGTNDPYKNERVGSDVRSGSGIGRRYINSTDFNGRRLQVPVQIPATGQMFYGFMNKSVDIGAFLDALASDNKAELLASPVTLAINHRPAEVKLVDAYPYSANTSFTGGATHYSTEFIDIGITMEVTPHIREEKPLPYVELDLNTEVSHFTGSSNGVPIRSVRSYKNTNIVEDGQTLTIGGVFRNDDKKFNQEMPVLGKVPVLRHFFRHKEKTKIRTELLIFVTPNIHRTPDSVTFENMVDNSVSKLVKSTVANNTEKQNE